MQRALPVIPFRWDVTRPEQLGRVIADTPAPAYDGFRDDLRRCCAAVVSAAPECDLLFVGRSPESLFDYLCGVFDATPWRRRVGLMLFSMRDKTPREVRRNHAAGLEALAGYFSALGVDPQSLLHRERPVALVDLVFSGDTFSNLVSLVYGMAQRDRVDWRSVRRKLRLVGIIESEPSPDYPPVPWQRRRRAVRQLLESRAVRNVTVPLRLWEYLGNNQPKVACSYPPDRWGMDWMTVAPRGDLGQPLRLARDLFLLGTQRRERLAFVRALSEAGGLRHATVRRLALAVRGRLKSIPICEIIHGYSLQRHDGARCGSSAAAGPVSDWAATSPPAAACGRTISSCARTISRDAGERCAMRSGRIPNR